MILRDISFLSPKENLLFDEVLLALAENGKAQETLRFWESQKPFIVLGKISKPQEDINVDRVKRDSIPVLRRASGGGTVLQGKGCLNYTLILSKEKNPSIRTITKSYQLILEKVICALGQLNTDAVFHPPSDIVLVKQEKKISGNAQKRGKKFILHHGTILYHYDLSLIERYLKIPVKIPAYRQGRSHHDFLINADIAPEAFKKALSQIFKTTQSKDALTDKEAELLRKYLTSRGVF